MTLQEYVPTVSQFLTLWCQNGTVILEVRNDRIDSSSQFIGTKRQPSWNGGFDVVFEYGWGYGSAGMLYNALSRSCW